MIEILIGIIVALLAALGGVGVAGSRARKQRDEARRAVHEVENVRSTERKVNEAQQRVRKESEDHRNAQPTLVDTRPTGDFGDSRLQSSDSGTGSGSVLSSSSSSPPDS